MDLDRLFAWLPFDPWWLVLGATAGFVAGVVLVLWFVSFVLGPAC